MKELVVVRPLDLEQGVITKQSKSNLKKTAAFLRNEFLARSVGNILVYKVLGFFIRVKNLLPEVIYHGDSWKELFTAQELANLLGLGEESVKMEEVFGRPDRNEMYIRLSKLGKKNQAHIAVCSEQLLKEYLVWFYQNYFEAFQRHHVKSEQDILLEPGQAVMSRSHGGFADYKLILIFSYGRDICLVNKPS